MKFSQRVPETLLVFVLYLILACVALWSLITQFGSAVPYGHSTDYYQFHWNYWWMRHALTEGISFARTDFVLYPHTHDLVLHTLTPIWLPLYMIVEPLFGRHEAVNLMVLLSFPLTGSLTYVWLRRIAGNSGGRAARWAAFLGGLFFAFSPYMFDHAANTHLNLIPLWWFPLALLLWDEIAFARRLPRIVSALLMALALWGMALTDLQYAVWLPLILGPYVFWTLWQSQGRRLALVLWGGTILIALAGLLLIWPLTDLLAVENRSNPYEYPPAGMNTIRAYSLHQESLFGLSPLDNDRTMGRVLVWLIWGAVLYTIVRHWKNEPQPAQPRSEHPSAWFWLLVALPPLLLSLGPEVNVLGRTVRLPYLILHDLLDGQYRNPVRFSQPALLGLITFTILAWLPLLRRWERFIPLISIALGAVVLLDAGAFRSFPVQSLPQPGVYDIIASIDEDFVVLDVPVGIHYGWTGIGVGQYAMYYGPTHQKRMLNGTLSRMPYSTLGYYLDSPLWTWLAGVDQPEPEAMPAITDQFTEIIRTWPVGYVIAHREWMTENQALDWIGWLNMQPDLCPGNVSADGSVIWWRTTVLDCNETPVATLDIGTDASWAQIGQGWYWTEDIGGMPARWSQATATLRASVDDSVATDIQLRVLAFGEGRSVIVRTPAWTSDEIDLLPEWQTVTVRIPPGALSGEMLTLEHNGARSPSEMSDSPDTRSLAAAYAEIRFHSTDDR